MGPKSEPQSAVIEQAIEWHQRLEEGDMDPESRREFSAWMQTPAHAKELARICFIHELVRRTPLEGESEGESGSEIESMSESEQPPAPPHNVIHFPSNVSANVSAARPVAPKPASVEPVWRRFTRKMAIAAGAVVAVLVATVAGVQSRDPTIVTKEGRWEKQLLEDGSVVHAGPNTRLSFHFTADERAVTLVQGEAVFEVAKEPDRPFIVSTDAGTVEALGTVFGTADVGDEVVVTVDSGKVGVRSPVVGAQSILEANQQVVLSSIGVSEPVTVDADRELKWIRNWYEYHGEPVGEIIEQLNRRNAAKVIVDDPQVTRLRFSSVEFKPSEPEQFVALINHFFANSPNKSDNGGTDTALHLQQP